MFAVGPAITARLPRVLPAALAGLGLLLALAGCRSTPAAGPRPPAHDPAWVVKQGQAVWRPDSGSEELTGELVLATHPDGRAFAQFAKPPVTLVFATWAPSGHWRVELPLRRDVLRGRGEPEPPLGWVELLQIRTGGTPAPGWSYTPQPDGAWRLANELTGEVLEGFVAP